MLTALTAPAFAETWYIEDGDITISAGKDGNDVTQKGETTYGDKDTVITNHDKDNASSNTVTIDAKDENDKVEVTLKDVNIDTSKQSKAAVSVTGKGRYQYRAGWRQRAEERRWPCRIGAQQD